LYSYQSGLLSIEQRRAVLNLIPKPNKDIRYLKNWRPISLLNTDYKILAKPQSCPECGCPNLHVKRFFWGDLPKEFVNAKLQGLLDSLSAEALYEVVQYLDGGPFRGSQRAFIGKFYLKASRLGSTRAMERLIFFYEAGMHVRKSILRSMAWAKRRYDFDGGEQPQLFDYLQTKKSGGDIGAWFARWKDQDASLMSGGDLGAWFARLKDQDA
jgi:hypothetical protein